MKTQEKSENSTNKTKNKKRRYNYSLQIKLNSSSRSVAKITQCAEDVKGDKTSRNIKNVMSKTLLKY